MRQSETRNRALLESIPDLIYKFNRQGEFLDYQTVDDDLLYAPPEEFLGQPVSAVLPPERAEATLDNIQRAPGKRRNAKLRIPAAA